VRYHYSQKNQEAQLERALGVKEVANLHYPWNDFIPSICPHVLYCRRLIAPISLMNWNDKADQEISDDITEDTGESTFSSDIEEDDFDHHLAVVHLG
jgi:hypothetical protein